MDKGKLTKTQKELVEQINYHGEFLVALYFRWLDERKYEGISLYEKQISTMIHRQIKITQKPFGFKIEEEKIRVSITGGNKAELKITVFE